jgi:hypothetical protein
MKSSYYLIILISSSVVAVLLWYLLSQLGVTQASEIAVLLLLFVITALITILSHGKGILFSSSKKESYSDTSRNFIFFSYKRKKYSIAKKLFEKKFRKEFNQEQIKEESYSRPAYLSFSYQREAFIKNDL